MFAGWDALGLTVLFVAWPGLTLVSAYAIRRALRFYRGMHHAEPGRLVLLTVVGWVLTLAGVALVSTFYLRQAPMDARPIVLPVFVLWAGALVTVVWVVQRWGHETETLDAYYGELERIERMKSSFINHIAHEFNTPMTPIRIQMRLLRGGSLGELTERQATALDHIDRNLDRLGRLVDQVMLASRIQAGQTRLSMDEFDVRGLLQEIAAAGHERVTIPAGPSVPLVADRSRLGYALETIMVELSRRAEANVEVDIQGGNRPTVAFRYHGQPLRARDLAAFSDPDRMEQVDGIGVALYNAEGLVRLHGGRLETRDDSVVVRLPARPTDAKATPTPV